MYEFLRAKSREPFTALYFKSEPTLPMDEQGERFVYREAPRFDSVDNVIPNVKERNAQKSIETTSPIRFIPDGYVVIDDTLWRINTVTATPRTGMAAAINRRPPVTQTLQIQQVYNPTGARV